MYVAWSPTGDRAAPREKDGLNLMAVDMNSTERERAMISAYRAGVKVTEIEKRFGVGRSTLYHILRRAGIKPQRTKSQIDAASGDARLAGLAELIAHQDALIAELQAAAAGTTKRMAKLERENASLRSRLGDSDGHRQGAGRRGRAG